MGQTRFRIHGVYFTLTAKHIHETETERQRVKERMRESKIEIIAGINSQTEQVDFCVY